MLINHLLKKKKIVTSKYGTSTGIHKTDTDVKQCMVEGGGGRLEGEVPPLLHQNTELQQEFIKLTDMKQCRVDWGRGGG